MRIALASIHPRLLSGQIEGLVGLAQTLHERGHTVRVVSAFPSGKLLDSGRLSLANKPRWAFIDEPMRALRILGELVSIAPQVDVIQLNLPTPAFSILGDILQGMVAVPVVVGYEAHLANPADLLRMDRLPQAPQFYLPRLLINNRLVSRITLNSAARYVVSSKYQRSELLALGVERRRIHLLPNVLPKDKLVRSSRVKSRASFPPGRLITYVGHYNHVKGADVLVRAFSQLAPRVPDARLVLAWSGVGKNKTIDRFRKDLEAQGRIVQLGKVNVPDLLSASDVVALPYRLTIGQAAYPATLLEALAANVPVVTSDLPLLCELTQGGRTALLAPPDDPMALAASIERLLTEPSLVEQMLQAQRAWVHQIQPQRVIREYEELYEQVTCPAPVLQPAPERERVR